MWPGMAISFEFLDGEDKNMSKKAQVPCLKPFLSIKWIKELELANCHHTTAFLWKHPPPPANVFLPGSGLASHRQSLPWMPAALGVPSTSPHILLMLFCHGQVFVSQPCWRALIVTDTWSHLSSFFKILSVVPGHFVNFFNKWWLVDWLVNEDYSWMNK